MSDLLAGESCQLPYFPASYDAVASGEIPATSAIHMDVKDFDRFPVFPLGIANSQEGRQCLEVVDTDLQPGMIPLDSLPGIRNMGKKIILWNFKQSLPDAPQAAEQIRRVVVPKSIMWGVHPGHAGVELPDGTSIPPQNPDYYLVCDQVGSGRMTSRNLYVPSRFDGQVSQKAFSFRRIIGLLGDPRHNLEYQAEHGLH